MKVLPSLSSQTLNLSFGAPPRTIVFGNPRDDHAAENNFTRAEAEIQLAIHLVYPEGPPSPSWHEGTIGTRGSPSGSVTWFCTQLNSPTGKTLWKTTSMSSTPICLHCLNKTSCPLPPNVVLLILLSFLFLQALP